MDALWQGAIVPIPSLVAAQQQADVVVFGLEAPVRGRGARAAALPRRHHAAARHLSRPGGADPVLRRVELRGGECRRCRRRRRIASPAPRCRPTDPRAEIHASAAGTRAQNAPANTVLPFHPGAARYYAERGITVRAG